MRIFEAKLNNWYSIPNSGWKFYYFHPIQKEVNKYPIWFVYRQLGYNPAEYGIEPASPFRYNAYIVCRPVKKKEFPNDVLVALQEAKVELL